MALLWLPGIPSQLVWIMLLFQVALLGSIILPTTSSSDLEVQKRLVAFYHGHNPKEEKVKTVVSVL